MLKIEDHCLFEEFGTNTWLLWDEDSREAWLIDPAAPSEALLARPYRRKRLVQRGPRRPGAHPSSRRPPAH